MPELNEKTKTTLGAAGLVMLGALSAQGWTIVQLAGKASSESVEKVEAKADETYVRKDVLEPQMRSLQESVNAARTELSQLRVEVATLRAEGAGGK